MPDNETVLLSDKQIFPTDDYIFSIIGEKRDLWNLIMQHMHENYKDSGGEWNFYNDGKRWLFKMLLKKKTVFWIGILEDAFMVTFWFSDKAGEMIEGSDLHADIKNEYKNAKKYGSVRAVSVKVLLQSDVAEVIKLITIKIKLK